MAAQELEHVYTLLQGFGFGVVVSGIVVFLLVKFYLSSYLSEKGKNLATREDVQDITNRIEEVKHQYTALTEELKARHQLRMAAVDKRLESHQQAFSLWRKVLNAAHGNEIGQVVIECQTWWENNCIYLEPQVRDAFVKAYSAAHLQSSLVRSRADSKVITENWKEFTEFPNKLFAAVQLPLMSELEATSNVAQNSNG